MGQIKTVTLKRECERWHVCFSVLAVPPEPMSPTGEVTGIDVGLESFAVLSDGTVIHNPRHYRKAQAALRRAQRKVATGGGRQLEYSRECTNMLRISGLTSITRWPVR
jgi:putative transposase